MITPSWPPAAPTVIASRKGGWPDAQVFASIEDVAAWFVRQAFGRKLEFLEQDIAYGADGDPVRCPQFPAVAVFARKARGGADEWLGWACGPQIEGARHFERVVDRIRSAGGMAA